MTEILIGACVVIYIASLAFAWVMCTISSRSDRLLRAREGEDG